MEGRLIFKAVSGGIQTEADLREMSLADMLILSNVLQKSDQNLVLEVLSKMGKKVD